MEIQKKKQKTKKNTLNSQSNLDKEEWNWRKTWLTSGYTTKLQSSRQYGAGTKTEK